MSDKNVFAQLIDDPVEAQLLALKSKLMMTLKNLIQQEGWDQATAAARLSTSQARISKLCKGHIEAFTIKALVKLVVVAGYRFDMSLDRTNPDTPLTMVLKKTATPE
ncbi:hypothetical protein D3C80_1329500 [compost metagenome]